jgi:ABC-2 type transport system ATP-binding protein
MYKIIEIQDLNKDYETGFWRKKTTRALDGLSLTVHEGQIFGFLGGNGAGKTTTIKILMRLLFPTGGSAKILGEDISSVDMHRHVGFCPENPYFYDYLTPLELFNYFGKLFGFGTSRREAKTKDLLSRVGLSERDWSKQLRKFSKGMLQRVGIAQSLINDPKLVFLDEPMSGLDPIGRREIRELIAGLPAAGTSVFMSTHILSDAEALCDEVAILRSGRVAATGRIEDLLDVGDGAEQFEILVKGASFDSIKASVAGEDNLDVSESSGFVMIRVPNEPGIDLALASARKCGASIVSINPVRGSLEDYFHD